MPNPQAISIQQLISALRDVEKPLSPRFLYRLSDLEPEDSQKLEESWPALPAWRRQSVIEDVEELGESDPVLSFEAVCRIGIKDTEASVREPSVRSLWDYEVVDLIPTFLQMVVSDPDTNVRAATATALGKFIYLGEIEEIREASLREVEDKLLAVTNGADHTLVRRRALESLGFSSRGEVPRLIEKAYHSGNRDWLVTSLFAMGRSANRKWVPLASNMLANDSPDVRAEAARALGELEVKKAVPDLIELLQDDDVDVRMAVVWSLSQIGGEGVLEALEQLYDSTEDDEEADFIASALENLTFTESTGFLDMMDIYDDDEDE